MPVSLFLHITPKVIYYQDKTNGGAMEVFVCDECTSLSANIKVLLAMQSWAEDSDVEVLVEHERYVLVPLSMYEDGSADVWFETTMTLRDSDKIFSNTLPLCDAVCVFAVDRFVASRLSDAFPAVRFVSQTAVYAERFAAKNKEEGATEVYAMFGDDYVHAYAFRRGQLLSASSFRCQLADDSVYFLLSVFKNAQFDERIHALHIHGQALFLDNAEASLRKFIKHVDRSYEDNSRQV